MATVEVPATSPAVGDNPGATRALLALLLDMAKTEGLIDDTGRVRIPVNGGEQP